MNWRSLKCLQMGLSFMDTFIGVCRVSPGPLPCNSYVLEVGKGGVQMHAIMLVLSKNVPILVLKVYVLGNSSVLGKWYKLDTSPLRIPATRNGLQNSLNGPFEVSLSKVAVKKITSITIS